MSISSILLDYGKQRLFRYVVTGGVTAIVYFLLAFVFIEVFSVRASVSSFIAFILIIPLNYILHKVWSYESRRLHREAVPRFLAVTIAGLLLNSAIIEILIFNNFHYFIAQTIAALTVIAWNLILFNVWVFHH